MRATGRESQLWNKRGRKQGATGMEFPSIGTVEDLIEEKPVVELTREGLRRPVTVHNVLRLKG